MVIINKIFHLYHGNHSYKIMTNLVRKGKRAKRKTREVPREPSEYHQKQTLLSPFYSKKNKPQVTFFFTTTTPLSFLKKKVFLCSFVSSKYPSKMAKSFLFSLTLNGQPPKLFLSLLSFLPRGPNLCALFIRLFIAKAGAW